VQLFKNIAAVTLDVPRDHGVAGSIGKLEEGWGHVTK
jgi:hypothetical protein